MFGLVWFLGFVLGNRSRNVAGGSGGVVIIIVSRNRLKRPSVVRRPAEGSSSRHLGVKYGLSERGKDEF
jgi:hypothetical protein